MGAGYSLDSIVAFDMFPQTHHGETIRSWQRRVKQIKSLVFPARLAFIIQPFWSKRMIDNGE
jgi:hypothetical protein